ncbi:helix-turn-helix domain-containing protein [Microbacterium sp. B19]|uniref:helix-turn-helix domain-containing protein n=1 Tax=Microbacterium sp. B19 TaxID=96765 RepID=UPI00165166F6|nr:helix-turn-helix domain-containing protein [Microbacterium sp. B19]
MTRSVRAEGPAAREWFAQRSLEWTPMSEGPAILIVDEAEMSAIVIRRLWHTAARIAPAPALARNTGATLVLEAEGRVDYFFRDGRDVPADTAGALVFPNASFAGLVSQQPSARIEVVATHRLLDGPSVLPGADDGPAWRALASTINAILNTDRATTPSTRAALGHAIESLCAALIADRAGAGPDPAFRSAEGTFAAAMQLVDEQADDPEFTVEQLADALGVSRQYLARVFSRRGSTPRNALRTRRLELAEAFTAVGIPTAEVVRRSGFPSQRALSHARRERDAQRFEL